MTRRLISEHFRTDGKPKRAWPNEHAAAQAALSYEKEYYRCTLCGHFHLGSSKRHKE